jgi:hypothetical protein
MQRKMPYVLAILIVLLLGSGVVSWADAGVCPVDPADNDAVVDLPQEEVLPSGKDYTYVDRNQVLLEVFGRVT